MGTDEKNALLPLAYTLLALVVVLCPIRTWAFGCPPLDAVPGVAARGGDVLVELSPTSVLLGSSQTVTVTTRLPTDAVQVEVRAFFGAIKDVRLDPSGQVYATYEPPSSFTPAVEIVAVIATREARSIFGFAALPLVGQGTAKVRTRPNARAVIRIGTDTFGPVRADAKGVAEISVHVPPGVSCGYDDRRHPVALGAPPPAAAALFVRSSQEPLVAGQSIEVFGVVVADDGSALELSETDFAFSSIPGTVEIVRRDADGVLSWRVGGMPATGGNLSLSLSKAGSPAVERVLSVAALPPSPKPPSPSPSTLAPPPWVWRGLAIGATAGIAGSFGDALGPWVGLSLTGRARFVDQSVHLLLSGLLFVHGATLPLEGLTESQTVFTAHATTWLVPVLVGFGWSRPWRGRLFVDVTGLVGAGFSQTSIELPSELEMSASEAVSRSAGASLGARVGMGLLFGQARARLDAGYLWTSPGQALTDRPGLSLWNVSLSFDREVLSAEETGTTAGLPGREPFAQIEGAERL